jgi:3-oxoacyl-[acyl-carrier protein] reductase
MRSNPRFFKRVAIITGSANGIGREIAIAFAREGATLGLIDVDRRGLDEVSEICQREHSARVITLITDISKAEEMDAAVKKTIDEFGTVDILVNNAGILPDGKAFEDIEINEWKRIFDINFFGMVYGCQAVIPIMKKNHFGRIINASSMYGLVPQFHHAPYSATKAAAISISRVLASELGPFGITVNAYAPGATRTKLAEESLKGERGIAKLREIPIGRFNEPEDVANVVLFLAAEESDAVNGHVLVVDGGTLCIQSPTRASQINVDSSITSYQQ